MKTELRQQEIVDATIRIIAREGFQELTTKRLAAEINLSEAALYRHFASKTDILHKVLEYFQTVAAEAMQDIRTLQDNPLEQVKAFVFNRYKLFMSNPDLARVMFSDEIFQHDRSLAEHNLGIMHTHGEQLIRSLKAAQEQGLIRSDLDTRSLFRIIAGSLRLLVNQWQLSNYGFDLLQEGEKLWTTIKQMIIKEQS